MSCSSSRRLCRGSVALSASRLLLTVTLTLPGHGVKVKAVDDRCLATLSAWRCVHQRLRRRQLVSCVQFCLVLCVIVISVIITVVYYCANKSAKHTVKYKMRAHWIIYRNITSACTSQCINTEEARPIHLIVLIAFITVLGNRGLSQSNRLLIRLLQQRKSPFDATDQLPGGCDVNAEVRRTTTSTGHRVNVWTYAADTIDDQ